MSTENDTCVQHSVSDEEPVQESLQISVGDRPTATLEHLQKFYYSHSVPSLPDHEFIPTTDNMSAPSKMDSRPDLCIATPHYSSTEGSSKSTDSISSETKSTKEVVPKSSQSSNIESSVEIPYLDDTGSPGADDEMEESPVLEVPTERTPLRSVAGRVPVNTSAPQSTGCCARCEPFVMAVTRFCIYVSLLAQVILVGLLISAVIMGLVYRNRCSRNETSLIVLVMGCTGLGYFVLRVVSYFYSVFRTPRRAFPCEILAYLSLMAFVIALCYETTTLPLPGYEGPCDTFFHYTYKLNIAIAVNIILALSRYINILYELFCKCYCLTVLIEHD